MKNWEKREKDKWGKINDKLKKKRRKSEGDKR